MHRDNKELTLITLPIVTTYVSNWTIEDAARELLQNAIDSKEWAVASNGDLINKGELLRKHWLLGNSDKPAGSIGQFGEGLKLAALVLCRNNYRVQISSSGVCYEPIISYQADWDAEVLQVLETYCDCEPGVTRVHVEPALDWQVLPMPDSYRVLRNEKKLYVGGLYVCELPHFEHGYNMDPSSILLGRDRNAISDFAIAYESSRMISKQLSPTEQLKLLQDPNKHDALYLHCFAANDGLIKLFRDSYAYSSFSGARAAVLGIAQKAGLTITSNQKILQAWYDVNKKHMRSKARQNFKQLMEKLK